MTTSTTGDVLDSNEIDVHTLSSDVDLVAALREASTHPQRGQACSWELSNLRDDLPWYQQPSLIVGLRDGHGALTWNDDPPMVPANGTNAEPVDYWIAGLHHTPMSARAELPLEQALDAVAEFMRTGQRPTCLEWVEA